MLSDDSTSSALIGPSARSDRRCAILAAVSPSSLGSGLKMPPGDLPVTIAQVAKVTRSAASRGGTSELSALATASWLSAPARLGLVPFVVWPDGPDGLVGGGGIEMSDAGGSACGSGAGAAADSGVAPLSSAAC